MNRLDRERQATILQALVEGNSLRAASRMANVSINTVTKLLIDTGRACAGYQDEVLRNLPCKRIQCDEIWSFCYAKEKNVPEDKRGKFGYGNVWTWTAICVDSKLVPCWLVAERNATAATAFIQDLASRLKHRVQLTTDGHLTYLEAVEGVFGSEIDYSMLVKIYGNDPPPQEVRYSPAVCLAVQYSRIQGNPDPKYVSTSFAERNNLTMRMGMRRFTRLTNAFSKKVQNLEAAVVLHFMHYNLVRIHKSLRVTPAMAAGVAKRPWEIEGILDLVEQRIYQAN
jgi:IS1 family transposase